MQFDLEKFRGASFEVREGTVEVPSLASFFGEDEEGNQIKPEFKVRGLSGVEIAKTKEDVARAQSSQEVIKHASSKMSDDMLDAVKLLVGGEEGSIPDQHVQYISVVEMGSVQPKLNRQDVVRLGKFYPVEFQSVALKVLELTGLGATEKK